MFGYNVQINERIIKDWHSGEQYGAWETESRNNFESISKAEDGGDILSTHDMVMYIGLLVYIDT